MRQSRFLEHLRDETGTAELAHAPCASVVLGMPSSPEGIILCVLLLHGVLLGPVVSAPCTPACSCWAVALTKPMLHFSPFCEVTVVRIYDLIVDID